MAATPAPNAVGGEASARPLTLTRWLRERSDRQLTTLLRLRPDLALPAPHDLSALGVRIGVRTSTQRAVDGLDAHTLHTLETLVLAAGDGDTVEDIDNGTDLEGLFDRALIWGAADLIHLSPSVRETLGLYPTGLGRPAALLLRLTSDSNLVPVLRRLGLPAAAQPRSGAAVAGVLADSERLASLIAESDADERSILTRMAAGPPVGTVRSVRPAEDSAPGRLMGRGLLVPIDSQRVELPREVGLALRSEQDPVVAVSRPSVREIKRTPGELDLLGTTAVAEFLRLTDLLAQLWTVHPPALLRSGGVGVRELRRTARELGVEEAWAAVVVEVAFAAGLLNSTSGPDPVYLPTAEYDDWAERDTAARWITLATAWLAMSRQPSLVNERGDRDRVITALGPDVERGTVPALRRHVLDTLATLAPGAAPADRSEVLDLLAWHQPRRAAGQRRLAEAILDQSDLLGITAAGGVTGWTRTLLADATGALAATSAVVAAERALEHSLPTPVDHFLVQPDLTVVVPGPPARTIATDLAVLADLESSGGASVYRITEASVRRALDAGRSAAELGQFLAVHSRTPVPQALAYLLDDAARRHGVLRAGTAGSYLRCEDEALLARVVSDRATAGLGLRLLAPTVVVADVAINRVLEALREAGYAPAAESADGQLVTLTAEAPRAPGRPAARVVSARVGDTDVHLAQVVRRMRDGDDAMSRSARIPPSTAQFPGVTSATTMELLRKAVREGRSVRLGCAETDGSAGEHVMQPISLAAGAVRGYEPGRPGLTVFPLHRITSLRLLEDPDELVE